MQASGWDIIIALFVSLVVIGFIFKFFWTLIKARFDGWVDNSITEDQRFNFIETKLNFMETKLAAIDDKLEERLTSIDITLKEILYRSCDLNLRLSICETRIEERKPIFYPPVVASQPTRTRRARRTKRKPKGE